MGSESGSGHRAEPNTCTDRERGQDMGRHGHAKSAEGQVGELQDTAGVEGGGRITQECHGQEYVLLPTFSCSFVLTKSKVNKKSLVKEIFGDQA